MDSYYEIGPRIGSLERLTASLRGQYAGSAFIGEVSCAIRLVPANVRLKPDAPTHRVSMSVPDGANVRIGSAWGRRIHDGPRGGQVYIFMHLDHPAYLVPVHLAAFQDHQDGLFKVCRRVGSGWE
jgi:uncharacterized protein (DUF736 family)